jgi:hypothetical protein
MAGPEIAIAAQVVGTIVSFVGSMNQASAQEDMANYQAQVQKQQAEASAQVAEAQAAQLEYQKGQTERAAVAEGAAAQREALVEKHKARLAQSRLSAVVGSSGGGLSDPTIQNLESDISAEGNYRAANALYSGDVSARSLLLQSQLQGFDVANLKQSASITRQTGMQAAGLTRLSGQIEASGTRNKAYSTLLSSGSSLYSKYGAPTTTSNLPDGFGERGDFDSVLRGGSYR